MPETTTTARPPAREPDTAALATRFIAGLLVAGAAWMLAGLMVPIVLALILAIAMSPVVSWLEKRGVPTTLGALACMLSVATVLGVTLGLMVYQAGTVLQNSDKYIERVANVVSRVSGQVGGDQVMQSFGLMSREAGTGQGAGDRASASGEDGGESAGGTESSPASESGAEAAAEAAQNPDPGENPKPVERWEGFLRNNLRTIGSWIFSGLGGLVGFVAGLIVFLAFLFYMLQTRAEWVGRLTMAMAHLGMRPRISTMEKPQREIEVFVGFVSIVAASYAVVTTIVYWAIGLPTPLLWGLLTGLLEFIPFFGPTIAGSLVTLVALTTGALWKPLAVIGLFVALHLVEGYIITPMVYGSAVKIDPVTTLLGVLFFGWIWGPLGSMLAMPTLILLRGLIVMTPDTPALDAIADVEDRKPAEDKAEEAEPEVATRGA